MGTAPFLMGLPPAFSSLLPLFLKPLFELLPEMNTRRQFRTAKVGQGLRCRLVAAGIRLSLS